MTRADLDDFASRCQPAELAALCGAAARYLADLSPEDRDDPRLWVWLVAFNCRERGVPHLWAEALAAVKAERRALAEANRRAARGDT